MTQPPRHLLVMIALAIMMCLGADKKELDSHEVSIEGLEFKPAALTIHAGDTVVWINNGDRDYALVARDGSFKSGVIHRNERFSFKFDKAGKFPYGCRLHPRMKGTVVVEPRK